MSYQAYFIAYSPFRTFSPGAGGMKRPFNRWTIFVQLSQKSSARYSYFLILRTIATIPIPYRNGGELDLNNLEAR